MVDPENDARAAFVRHWQRVGPLLEKIANDELRNLDEATAREIIDSLLSLPCPASPRLTSGLVEMQRKFRKLWR
jgi:hypothetical protein